jgi:3-hydroxyisobutyrate dehydrogenase-like beta-hydroxyacid dehydrogenase
MGAGVGARLAANGARVITALEGRSRESIERAKAAKMAGASQTEMANADVVLSIVPPKDALAVAQDLAPALREANRKPLYVECNAISPETTQRIASVIEPAGCPFVDAGIIGAPPRVGQSGPRFYVSGREAAQAAKLKDYGLDIRDMGGEIGDASALKLCYATLTKGFTALGAASAAAASRAGVADLLHAELAASQPAMLAYLSRSVPIMFPKAYRWVAEMEEIGRFFGREGERTAFTGIADIYEQLARDHSASKIETGALEAFFARDASSKPR